MGKIIIIIVLSILLILSIISFIGADRILAIFYTEEYCASFDEIECPLGCALKPDYPDANEGCLFCLHAVKYNCHSRIFEGY